MYSKVNYNDFELEYWTIDSHLTSTVKSSKYSPTRETRAGRIWEKKLFDFYKDVLKPDDIVYDVGAYIGTHALPLSKFCKYVVAFEPSLEIYDVLTKNMKNNNINNVLALNRAVGLGNELEFFEKKDGSSRFNGRKGKKSMKKTIRLDHLKPQCLVTTDRVDLIKIDVEGHEFDVLEGARLLIEKNRPIILIEVFKKKKNKLMNWCFENEYIVTPFGGDDYILRPLHY